MPQLQKYSVESQTQELPDQCHQPFARQHQLDRLYETPLKSIILRYAKTNWGLTVIALRKQFQQVFLRNVIVKTVHCLGDTGQRCLHDLSLRLIQRSNETSC